MSVHKKECFNVQVHVLKESVLEDFSAPQAPYFLFFRLAFNFLALPILLFEIRSNWLAFFCIQYKLVRNTEVKQLTCISLLFCSKIPISHCATIHHDPSEQTNDMRCHLASSQRKPRAQFSLSFIVIYNPARIKNQTFELTKAYYVDWTRSRGL